MQVAFYEALASTVGVRLISIEPDADIRKLHKIRAADPTIAHLKILKRSDNEIWIVHPEFCQGNHFDAEKARQALEASARQSGAGSDRQD